VHRGRWIHFDIAGAHRQLGEVKQHMVNREMLRPMRRTAWLNSAAQGPLTDEAALLFWPTFQ
jgi:phosphoglycerate dehydrogenase-like enzyme